MNMNDDEQIEALKKAAYELAAAYWRLERYGMINDLNIVEPGDIDSFELWRDIANQAFKDIQRILT